MRSSEPMPGNPWPHDMMLTIEDSPHALNDLLWVREAWGLQIVGADLPPLLTETPEPTDAAAPDEWAQVWPELWVSCLAQAGELVDPLLFEKLRETADNSSERALLLNRLMGPSWRDRFGDSAFTPSYHEWLRARFEKLTEGHRQIHSLNETPERISLGPLIAAWESGITKLVLIPCHGTFTRRIGPATLLLTEQTRADPERYSEALTLGRGL